MDSEATYYSAGAQKRFKTAKSAISTRRARLAIQEQELTTKEALRIRKGFGATLSTYIYMYVYTYMYIYIYIMYIHIYGMKLQKRHA